MTMTDLLTLDQVNAGDALPSLRYDVTASTTTSPSTATAPRTSS
jgi:hypothetical protein